MTAGFEVESPIQNSPFEAPEKHWYIAEDEEPELRDGRRPSIVFPPRDQTQPWDTSDGLLRPSSEYPGGYELTLVMRIRERVGAWRAAGYPGVTRTTLELLRWWQRDGRAVRLFYAQVEAVETIIFLTEARADFRQGIDVPRDEPSDDRKANGYAGFLRYACKMATGGGKTMVMGMLAGWSILNKVNNRSDGRFSDVVLVVCPNVTIRNRLRELDPEEGEASIYRTRDLVPADMMPLLRRGRVLVMNWHEFEPRSVQASGVSAKVVKAGIPARGVETILIGPKTTTARGKRYLTQEAFDQQLGSGLMTVLEKERDEAGNLTKVKVESVRYIESDTSLVNRVLGREVGGKQNILVMNDEAHHAYRIKRVDEEPEGGLFDEEEEEAAEEFFREATVWVDGLDRVHKLRGINFCVDLSATPYFLGRVGQETNKPFPWVVSDFGLIDAIESGLVKIPQLAVRDTTGAEIPGYFNIWKWIVEQLTPAERGGRKGSPKPEAILKYAHHPVAMLAGLWQDMLAEWEQHSEDPRPPVYILVCKNTKIARVIYEWLAEDVQPAGIPPVAIEGFRNTPDRTNTIRVDSKVVQETDTDSAKSDETRWMRLTLDTVGKIDWPKDRQGRPIYPEGFEELAKKLGRPLHPPGRDVRCIVSVGMLTEGWDCNTVTHIVGLRPFMSQLLCEQVVGRGLRRASYDLTGEGRFTEEVAKVFGVPFEIVPFKASPEATSPPREKRHHVRAVPSKEQYRIVIPRVEGYIRAIRNRVTVNWDNAPPLTLDPGRIPPEVEMKATVPNNQGRPSLVGPGRLEDVTLNPYRRGRRLQELVFDLSRALTRDCIRSESCEVPAHALFPQVAAIVRRYLAKRVRAVRPAEITDVFLSPYYGWVIERLTEAIQPDTSQGESPEIPKYEANRGPITTDDVDFWTSRDVREIVHSHVNYVVADTRRFEQQAAYYIDRHPATAAFVKNEGLGFAIPYLHNGQMHDYMPDFVVRLQVDSDVPCFLILETKGFDPLEEIKQAAAQRWVAAVNADGTFGRWAYAIVRRTDAIRSTLQQVRDTAATASSPAGAVGL